MVSNSETLEAAAHEDANAERADAESPVLIHLWEMLDPEQSGVVLQLLGEMLGEVSGETGFVSARVLEGDNRRTMNIITSRYHGRRKCQP